MRSTPLRLTMGAGLFLLGLSGFALAQAPTPNGTGWTGYNPGYVWGAAGPAVSANAPVATLPAQPVRAGSWAGYAPYRAWSGYNPGYAWQSYAPAAGTQPVVINAPRTTYTGTPYNDGQTRRFREYGSGRPVRLAKPWLTGSR